MELIKHLAAFNPSLVKGNIGVVGVGATGSATALHLAKLGLENLVLFDADIVNDHNLPNQILYGPGDIGKYKVDCAAKEIKKLTGYKPKVFKTELAVKRQITENNINHLFFCVDTMITRKVLFEGCVFLNGCTEYLVDMRMNAFAGQTILFEPQNLKQCRYYRSTLYSDNEVDDAHGGCQITLSIGATASLVASTSVLMWMKRLKGEDQESFEWKYNVIPPMWIKTTNQQMDHYLEQLEDQEN